MKKQIALGLIGMILAALGGHKAVAQDDVKKKETQEIVIRKTNDKDSKLVLEFSDGKVTINGKPLMEFNEEGLTVNNKKIMMLDGNRMIFNRGGENELIIQGEKLRAQGNKLREQGEKFREQGAKLRIFGDQDYAIGLNNNGDSWSETKEYTFLGVSTEKDEKGVKITNVSEKSPAAEAGLKEGDVIYKLEDTEISSSAALSKTVRAMKAGDKAKIYYYRDGKKKDVKATLVSKKSTEVRSFNFTMPDIDVNPRIEMPNMNFNRDFNFDNIYVQRSGGRLGISIQDTESGNGVKILEAQSDGAGAKAGLMKDDVITEINGNKVTNTDEAREQLRAVAQKSEYTMKALRGGAEQTFTVKIPKKLKTANL